MRERRKRLNRRLLGKTTPDDVDVLSHDHEQLITLVCMTRKWNPYTKAEFTLFALLMFATFGVGFITDLIQDSFGIDLYPQSKSGRSMWHVFFWLLLPSGTYMVLLRRLVHRRMHRFFRTPFCYHCEYEIPELICIPEEAAKSASALRCTECGKIIPRIVATRHATAG